MTKGIFTSLRTKKQNESTIEVTLGTTKRTTGSKGGDNSLQHTFENERINIRR